MSSIKQQLLDRLTGREAKVGVVGLGYVGLPLAVEFAEAGFDVIGLDVDPAKVEQINRGESYIPDIPGEQVKRLLERGKLCGTTEYADLRQVETISIPIDPLYLSWKLKTLNYTARFIELASEVNAAMPTYVVDKIATALNDERKPIRGSRILILGVAYKRDVNDVRESPALDILQLLQQRGAAVLYHDPYVPKVRLDNKDYVESELYSDGLVESADCVVIVTDHSLFDYQRILNYSKLVVDTRHATESFTGTARVVLL